MTKLRAIAMRLQVCTKKSNARSGAEGSVAIEYGFLLPALLLFIFVIIDAGRLIWTQTTLDRAVEAAARCGAIDAITCGTSSNIQNYAVAQAYGMTVAPSAFTPVTAACGKQVSASFAFSPSIAFLGTGTITLVASACYPIPPS